MKMKHMLILFLLLSGSINAKNVAVLPEIMRPDSIVVDENQFYVVEDTTIFIYSKNDYKFIKKFGKRGEGPREFQVRQTQAVEVLPQTDNLMINSQNKVSYFSKDGDFIKEIKGTSIIGFYRPLGKQYVGYGFTQENNKNYITFNFYDASLKMIKQFFRDERRFQPGGNIDPIAVTRIPILATSNNKIFLNDNRGKIHAFDDNGKKLYSIEQNYKKIEVTEDRKKRYRDFFKTDPRTRGQYEALKDRIKFPEYFPIIRFYHISNQKIYLLTYREKGDNREFYIFDLQGNLLKRTLQPLPEMNALELYPYTTDNNKLYQIIENEDEEEWELHITEIK